jgi:hypothetical protein
VFDNLSLSRLTAIAGKERVFKVVRMELCLILKPVSDERCHADVIDSAIPLFTGKQKPPYTQVGTIEISFALDMLVGAYRVLHIICPKTNK